MDLLCYESTSKSVAQKDPVLLLDDRVFDTMLKSETRCMPVPDYMVVVQKDLTPNLRKVVVDWMWEVSNVVRKREFFSVILFSCLPATTSLRPFLFLWRYRRIFRQAVDSHTFLNVCH